MRTCPRVSTFAWRISRAASKLGKWVRNQPGILARIKLGAVNSGLGRYQNVDSARDTAGFRTNRTKTRTFPRELASEAIVVASQILWPLQGEELSRQD